MSVGMQLHSKEQIGAGRLQLELGCVDPGTCGLSGSSPRATGPVGGHSWGDGDAPPAQPAAGPQQPQSSL